MSKKEIQLLKDQLQNFQANFKEINGDFKKLTKMRNEKQDEMHKKVSELETFKDQTVHHQVTMMKEIRGLKKEVDTLTQALNIII